MAWKCGSGTVFINTVKKDKTVPVMYHPCFLGTLGVQLKKMNGKKYLLYSVQYIAGNPENIIF